MERRENGAVFRDYFFFKKQEISAIEKQLKQGKSCNNCILLTFSQFARFIQDWLALADSFHTIKCSESSHSYRCSKHSCNFGI